MASWTIPHLDPFGSFFLGLNHHVYYGFSSLETICPRYDPWGWDQAPINHHYISINKPPVFMEAAPATPALLFGGPAV